MKLSQKVKDKIAEAALQFDLPISIVRGIVCQESSGWTNKNTRFEEGFYNQYTRHMKGISEEDKKRRATSWGPMQVMGQTAREMGFKGDFEDLLDLEIGLYWGCRYLKSKYKLYFKRWGWSGVIAAYNAGSPKVVDGKFSNQYYVNRTLDFSRSAL